MAFCVDSVCTKDVEVLSKRSSLAPSTLVTIPYKLNLQLDDFEQ